MKKLITLVLTLFVVMTFFSCGGGSTPSTPTATWQKYTDYLIKGKCDKAVKMLNKVEEEQQAEMAKFLEEALNEQGGLKSCEVLSEEISEDGSKAKLEVKYTWGNGKTKETTEKLVKTENGWACMLF